MAGDWIKVEVCTPDKPEVVAIAARLNLDQDAAFGKLVRLWIWSDQNTVDGNAAGVTDLFVDRYCFAPGFAEAMHRVGWLERYDGGIRIPNFDKHNGQTGKQRALTKKRVEKTRAKCNGPSVTSSVTKSLPEGEGDGERELIHDVDVKRGADASSADVDALEDFEWDGIRADCRKVCQAVGCRSKQDASLIVKAVVLSRTRFSADWLWDSVEAARRKDTDNRPRYFTGVLRSKCKEAGLNLNALLKAIEIPGDYFRGDA